MSQLPIFYSYRRCPYAIRARMTLLYAGIKVEIREILLSDKPEQMLTISPKGTVPVLQLPGGHVIDESLDIMHWALTQKDTASWLEMLDNQTQLEIDALIEENDDQFKKNLNAYKYPHEHPGAKQQDYRDLCTQFVAKLESRLKKHNFLFGDKITLADIAIFPFIRQFARVDEDWFKKSPYPQLINWLHYHTDSKLFHKVMQKYPPWKPSDPITILS